jgi:hypothetical protein
MSSEQTQASQQQNQGEGNRDAARQYNEATQEHVKSGKVEQAARDAEKQSPQEAERAEAEGRAHAKELDPEVDRDYSKPTNP